MGKPRMIILIRHAQSEGNKNRDIHQTIPDHRVKLTSDGWTQAHEAGRRLRSLLLPTDTLHFFTSPYRRTRETTEGILSTLTSDEPSPSPFPRSSIKVYEEPRLREQDFGNFQPCSAEMERMWQERADYGHFFYRIPNGESAADAYDRVSGFNESLWRQFGEEDCASVCVLVTHGLMSRVFLMKWYHFSVEYFEDLRNVNHCEFLIMRKQPDSGRYVLENKLRTWSELKRERLALKDKEKTSASSTTAVSEKDKEKEKRLEDAGNGSGTGTGTGTGVSSPAIPMRKKWGGCPNGCDHGSHYFKRENSMHAMQLNGRLNDSAAATVPSIQLRRPARRWQSSSEEEDGGDDPRGGGSGNGSIRVDVARSLDEVVSSPDGTPSFISVEDRLRAHLKSPKNDKGAAGNHLLVKTAGRDFGGSASGNTTDADGDTSAADDEVARKRGTSSRNAKQERVKADGNGERREKSIMGRGAMADALGDQRSDDDEDQGGEAKSDSEGEVEIEVEKVVQAERRKEEDVKGSVY